MKIYKCSDCVYYVEDRSMAYCENDVWLEIKISGTKLYTPVSFECNEFESRKKAVRDIT